MADSNSSHPNTGPSDPSKRDFVTLAAGSIGVIGAAGAALPLVSSLAPADDVLALSTAEVDIAGITEGNGKTVMWRGKPVFVRHRTKQEILAAEDADISTLTDKQLDKDRVQKPEWLVVLGNCTHLGCVPNGQKPTDERGEFGGWFCPCHGSHYDTSGRIRKGPAPTNLPVPPYKFVSDTKIVIG